jgi:hypothetical protein
MKSLLTFALIFICTLFRAQIEFQVKDFVSKETIPFVKIIPSNENPKISDLDGKFNLKKGNLFITLKANKYRDTLIELNTLDLNFSPTIIFLKSTIQQVEEVIVRAGENPAHRIINQVIENRKKNNPNENDPFSYDSYSKMSLSIDPSVLDSMRQNPLDTNFIEASKFIDSMYLFLIESTSERKSIPPYKNKEIIKSYRVSGFSDPMFATIFNEIQSFSFYENQFSILDKSYINPISFGGTNRYLFILQDTTIQGIDTTFTISFRPRKGKNFDGLKGQLFINTNGFAIEKVVAQPYEADSTFEIKIIQEYEFIAQKKWFPVKLSTEFEFKIKGGIIEIDELKPNLKLLGKGNTYLSNINLDPKLSRKDFDQIDIETAVGADAKSEKEWDSLRRFDLTLQERNTYRIIDSVSKVGQLDRFLRAAKILSTGKIPMGKFNANLDKILAYNAFEGTRLGFGLETSDKLMERINLGAYFGYGFKDKEFKYGAFSRFNLHQKKNVFLNLSYTYDVFERGGNFFHKNMFKYNLTENSRRIYIQNMEFKQNAEIEINAYLVPRIRMTLFSNYQRVFVSDDYQFVSQNPLLNLNNKFDIAETGIEFSWQFKEKIMQIGYERRSLGSKFPILTFKAIKGMSSIFDSQLDYTRLNTNLFHDVSLIGFGKFMYSVSASKTFGEVPLFLMHNAIGTNGKARISVGNTFETMRPSTFYSDEMLTIFTKLSLLAWKTKKSWFKPQLSFHHGFGIGKMSDKNKHLLNGISGNFETLHKGYFEGGIILDKLYISGFSAFGVGIFSNYGAYALPKFEKNLVLKLSFSSSF